MQTEETVQKAAEDSRLITTSVVQSNVWNTIFDQHKLPVFWLNRLITTECDIANDHNSVQQNIAFIF